VLHWLTDMRIPHCGKGSGRSDLPGANEFKINASSNDAPDRSTLYLISYYLLLSKPPA
jgi:hypothetical protein